MASIPRLANVAPAGGADLPRISILFGARDEAEKQYELAVNRQQSAIANLSVAKASIAKAEAQLDRSELAVRVELTTVGLQNRCSAD